MSQVNNSGEKSTFLDWFLGGLALACVVAVVKVGLWAWNLLMRFFNFVGDALSLLGQILVVTGLIVILVYVIALIIDALIPLIDKIRRRQSVIAAISSCLLPKLQTFRGKPGINQVDSWLALEVLGPLFAEYFGIRPDESAFYKQEADFSYFRAKELPKALLGPFKIVVEQQIFTPIYSSYRSGDEKVVKWINDAVTAVKKRHPLRITGRVLRLTTFVFGFRTGEGFSYETVEERGTDRAFIFNKILWPHFWPNASLLCSWVEMDFGLAEEPVHNEYTPVTEEDSPSPRLFLPSPSCIHDSQIIDVDPEIKEERSEDAIEDNSGLIEEAVESVRFVSERWQNDGSIFDRPEEVLTEDEEILSAALPFHPDPNLVFEQLALNRIRRGCLDRFDSDFNAEMNKEDSDDIMFDVPWLAAAVMELNGNIDPKRFRRLALRHYLSCEAVSSDPVPPEAEAEACINEPSEAETATSDISIISEERKKRNEQSVPMRPAMHVPKGF